MKITLQKDCMTDWCHILCIFMNRSQLPDYIHRTYVRHTLITIHLNFLNQGSLFDNKITRTNFQYDWSKYRRSSLNRHAETKRAHPTIYILLFTTFSSAYCEPEANLSHANYVTEYFIFQELSTSKHWHQRFII